MKSVEVVTFPGTGFFSKPLNGVGYRLWEHDGRHLNTERGKEKLLHIGPQVLSPSLLVSGARQIGDKAAACGTLPGGSAAFPTAWGCDQQEGLGSSHP